MFNGDIYVGDFNARIETLLTCFSLSNLLGSADVLSRYKRQLSDSDLLNLSPEELCKDRLSEEYFRLTTEGDCRDVVRYDCTSNFNNRKLGTPPHIGTGLDFGGVIK